jgi:UDP-N-acetyl-D-glucosamine dehydrogenase
VRFEEVSERARRAREEGREVVLVLGLGFVGTAVVANLSRTEPRTEPRAHTGGRRAFFVIGLDQDTPSGRDKAASLDRGRSPTYADDPSLGQVISAAAAEPKGLVGTVDPRCLALADVVVSCINLDLIRQPGQTEDLACPTDGYAAAMRRVGEHMQPGTLVCIESTLPLGMSDRVIYPALCEGQRKRGVDVEASPPLLAFCYERVMPGPNYLDSVNNYWRAYAGIDERSADRARDFLSKYVHIEKYPLWRHKTIRAAEMAKLLENSYRATNIAFIEEWARLAEDVGVDLFDVIHSVRVRRGTHDNMMFPGLGVGGYCLTKDALLAAFGAERLLGVEAKLPFSRRAILTNESMPIRSVELARRHFEGRLAGRKAALLGVTYRAGVADTRSSPAETVAKSLIAAGVEVRAWDPLVPVWEEVPQAKGCREAADALRGADIAVICLPDPSYRSFLPGLLAETLQPGSIVVDPWNMVADAIGAELARKGVRLEVFGRGDVPGPSPRPGSDASAGKGT